MMLLWSEKPFLSIWRKMKICDVFIVLSLDPAPSSTGRRRVTTLATGYTNWSKRDTLNYRLHLHPLEEEMASRQDKDISNTVKTNMIPPVTRGLYHKDLNMQMQMKQRKTTLRITLWRWYRPLKRKWQTFLNTWKERQTKKKMEDMNEDKEIMEEVKKFLIEGVNSDTAAGKGSSMCP